MNRTLLRQRLTAAATGESTTDAAPGTITVATTFQHPERGPVRCAAARPLAAELAAAGWRVRLAPVDVPPDQDTNPSAATDDADAPHTNARIAVFTACYLDHRGHAVGFGAAADLRDRAAAEAARTTVAAWADVLRTRRILLADPDPGCTHHSIPASSLGSIPGLASDRPHCNLVNHPATHLTTHLGTDIVSWPAPPADPGAHPDHHHGLCRHLLLARAAARRFAARGDSVVVIGHRNHPAALDLLELAPDRTTVVTTPADVHALTLPDLSRVSYVLQPGIPIEDTAPMIEALRERYGKLPGQHPDEYCYAASDHRAAVCSIARTTDLVLILGDPTHRHTRTLTRWARELTDSVHCVDDPARIPRRRLAAAGSIGLAPAATADPHLLRQVIDVFSGLGPLSVAHRHTTTTVHPLPATDPSQAAGTGHSTPAHPTTRHALATAPRIISLRLTT